MDSEINSGFASRKGKHSSLTITLDPRTWLIILAFCEKNVVRYALHVMNMIPILNMFTDLVLPILYTVIIMMCIKKNISFSLPATFVLFFTVLAILVTIIVYPQNTKYLLNAEQLKSTILPCLQWFIIGLFIVPDKKTVDLIGKVSCLAIAVETLFIFLYMIPEAIMIDDDMSRAYQLLPQVMFAVNYAFNSKKILPWFFSVIGMFYLLSMGTRGPFVIFGAFVFLKFLKTIKTKIVFKIILLAVTITTILLFLNSNLFLNLLYWLKDVFKSIGLSTRIIDYSIKGITLSNTSGRNEIFMLCWQKIKENPVFGYGIYGEWQWLEWNAHNIYLEILIHFGVILGSVILLWLIYMPIKAYVKTSNTYSRDIILVFVCFVFVRGIFGGSYLMYGMYFLIAFCLMELKRIKSHVIKHHEY